MADTAGMLLKDMLPQVMLRVDTLVSVLAVGVVTSLREPRGDRRVLPGARVIGMAAVIGAVTGEVVTGEAVTGIRPMDILGSAITARAMAIHPTGLAITVTATVGTMVRTTDTTLTATDTGRP